MAASRAGAEVWAKVSRYSIEMTIGDELALAFFAALALSTSDVRNRVRGGVSLLAAAGWHSGAEPERREL